MLKLKNAKYKIAATGTLLLNSPIDCYVPLKWIGEVKANLSNFKSYYCRYGGLFGHDIIGYKNIANLKEHIESCSLRRTKDILDLPPKIHYTEYVENSSYQKSLYTKVLADLLSKKEELLANPNPMAKLLKLRQVNGSPELVDNELVVDDDYPKKNARLVRLMELLDAAHERGEKTVVFSNWVEPLKTLYKFISKKYKTCVFTGTMSSEDREKHKRVFINNPEYTVLLGTIGAAGTSHTFTVARNVIFFDDPWNPSDKEQATDRLYRIGTKDSVNVFTIVAKDTVDEKVEKILNTKSGISKYIVDGKIDLKKNPDLLDLLLGKEN
jgi:SNF2 family DNA or RNA helicase